MTFRFIIRPAHILSTPKLLQQTLGAERTLRWPEPSRYKPSYQKDFFLTYPPIEELEEYAHTLRRSPQHRIPTRVPHDPTTQLVRILAQNQSERIERYLADYQSARTFASSTKPEQRRQLYTLGFPVPWTSSQNTGPQTLEPFGIPQYPTTPGYEMGLEPTQSNVVSEQITRYIVRPLRHSGGQGWRLTDSPSDFREGREYIQEVYPKDHEYRIIAIRGEPLITLYKRRPEHLSFDQPWNHTNGSSFVTVHNPDNNRLRHTDIYTRIAATDLFKSLDLIGLDIMLSRRNHYVITELNLCPAITIPDNLQRIKDHVLSDRFVSRS